MSWLSIFQARDPDPEPEPELPDPEPALPDALIKELRSKPKCIHCGGWHSFSCRRVKRVLFHTDGITPIEVEYFFWEDFPKDGVLWPDDLA